MKQIALLCWLTLIAVAHPALAQEAPAAPRNLRVIALTDFHGALDRAAQLATHVRILRETAPGPSIVIDAGDLFQGTLASNTAEGEPVIRFYNAIGVAAAAVGNHEFDYGPAGERSIPRAEGDDPRGALRARAAQAHFPFLACNIFNTDGTRPDWLQPSVVQVVDGIRVGIIGAATPQTVSTTVSANLGGLRFEEPAELVAGEALRLRDDEHVDVVILTIHEGGGCTDNAVEHQDDLSTCEEGELFTLLRQLPLGLIDVAVGGHTHKGMAKRLNGTAVLQSFSRGQQVGWANVVVGDGRAQVAVEGFTPVVAGIFQGEDAAPDAAVAALLAPDFERVETLRREPVGVAALDTIRGAFLTESALGNLVADAMHDAVPGTEVAFTNGGGLRANLPAGPLNYGHVFEALPFDNRLAKLRVTGAELQRILEAGLNNGGEVFTYSGVSFTAHGGHALDVVVNDQPLHDLRVYNVVTNDFLASGGSGMAAAALRLEQVEVLWDGPYILRDAVRDVLSRWHRDLSSAMFYDPAAPRVRVR